MVTKEDVPIEDESQLPQDEIGLLCKEVVIPPDLVFCNIVYKDFLIIIWNICR
jgi:hypothetical protein